MLSRKKILTAVAATALSVRLIFYIAALGSPYWHFHCIPGLDMATLLEFSEWGVCRDAPYFSFHRLLIYLIWRLNGMSHAPSLLTALQSLGGVLMAVLLADSAMRLFRSRWSGIAAGLLAALYGPFILYEGAILQESMANLLNVAAFWMLIAVSEQDEGDPRRNWQIFFCGMLLGATAVGRPVASGFLLAAWAWYIYLIIRNCCDRRRILFISGGIVSVLTGASFFNFFANGSFTPFFKVLEYTRQYNIEAAADPSAVTCPTLNILFNAIRRLPRLLVPWEIPENLNYHFLAGRLPLLEWLPGPAMLVPLAVAGLLILVGYPVYRKRWSREALLLLPLLTLLLPLCAREPIGRYRLLICPFLILAAAFPAVWLEKCTVVRRCAALAVILLLWLAAAIVPVPAAVSRRSSDHFAWALAIENKNGGAVAESVNEIRSAYLTDGNIKYLINLILRHLQQGEVPAAVELLSAAGNSPDTPPADRSICFYYLGVIAFEQNRMADVELYMSKVDTGLLPADLQLKYWYMRGEAARRRRDTVSALQYFRRGINSPGGPPALREHLQRLIALLLK